MKEIKVPDTNTKVGKYFMAIRRGGVSKKEAAIRAGYTGKNTANIEKTREFQAIKEYFKDVMIARMELAELADHLIDNIRQEGEEKIDRNARNGAIKIALEKIEPPDMIVSGEGDKVLIVLSD